MTDFSEISLKLGKQVAIAPSIANDETYRSYVVRHLPVEVWHPWPPDLPRRGQAQPCDILSALEIDRQKRYVVLLPLPSRLT
jgi:hypothetical protein